MFIAVNDDGTLHKEAFTEFLLRYEEHPDTHFKFQGQKVEGVQKALEAAKKLHANIPYLGIINWDFTIDENGEPILIEANIMGGSIWLSQMAHGCGSFGENTEEILCWIRKMRELKKTERTKFCYGKGEV